MKKTTVCNSGRQCLPAFSTGDTTATWDPASSPTAPPPPPWSVQQDYASDTNQTHWLELAALWFHFIFSLFSDIKKHSSFPDVNSVKSFLYFPSWLCLFLLLSSVSMTTASCACKSQKDQTFDKFMLLNLWADQNENRKTSKMQPEASLNRLIISSSEMEVIRGEQ